MVVEHELISKMAVKELKKILAARVFRNLMAPAKKKRKVVKASSEDKSNDESPKEV